jgi:hypothetical protein
MSNSISSNNYFFNKLTITILVICIITSILLCILVGIIYRHKVIIRYQSSRRRVNSRDPEFNEPISMFNIHQTNINRRNQLSVSTETYEDHDPEPWVPLNQKAIGLWGISFLKPPTNRPIILQSAESMDVTSYS